MDPSFFKMLLDPSAPHLPLPEEFVSLHMNNKIPNDRIFRCINGGCTWRVKIKQIGGVYCFADGWANVVEDRHLSFGDFVFFWLIDQTTFKMSIYSLNGCEKDVNDDHINPSFSTVITKHQSRLGLSEEFVRLTKMDEKKTVIVKNLDGEEWKVSFCAEKSELRYYLGHGWLNFEESNNLSEGDECVFKFIKNEDKLCLVKIIKHKGTEIIKNQEENGQSVV
ncbi:B3 domain-containing protein REM10-like [Rutidosis leptorrhynchoides]|uniref:B3 domain-containing protein REM10-like n=1 Tax=Rutidosis leptorrhynchoides TaxID=125765 RepID=UPI003A99404D